MTKIAEARYAVCSTYVYIFYTWNDTLLWFSGTRNKVLEASEGKLRPVSVLWVWPLGVAVYTLICTCSGAGLHLKHWPQVRTRLCPQQRWKCLSCWKAWIILHWNCQGGSRSGFLERWRCHVLLEMKWEMFLRVEEEGGGSRLLCHIKFSGVCISQLPISYLSLYQWLPGGGGTVIVV